MKKFRTLFLISALSLLLAVGVCAEGALKPVGYNQSLVNVCDMGAIPNDGQDDTTAFKLTVNAGQSIYVPAGTYDISEPLYVNSSTIMGSGTDKTVIISHNKSTRDPIVWAGNRSQIRDITFKFAEGLVSGTEIAGERVGLITTARGDRNLCRGGAVTNVRFQNVGTGIYAPKSGIINDKSTGSGLAFSAAFEYISVVDFSYRGIDMQADHRTGNIYRGLYFSSGKYKANIAFAMAKAESESAITEVTIADSQLKAGIHFYGIYGAWLTNVTFINTKLTENNTAYIYLDETHATIENLNFKNSAPEGANQSFLRVAEGAYRDSLEFDTGGYLRINNMSIHNEGVTVAPDSKQYMLARDNAYIHGYDVIVDNFRVVSAPEALKKQYEEFRFDSRAMNLMVNGKVLAGEEK